MIQFILASQSPRRRELLRLCGYPFEIQTFPVDEESITHPDPALNSIHTAQLKAQALAKHIPASQSRRKLVIAADTIVAADGMMLGKPADEVQAREMLQLLRNQTHEVHSGVSIIDLASAQEVHGAHTAEVTMRDYSDAEISAYIATGDPFDKAGAYAIQHLQFQPAAQLNGCLLGVMGLSICHLLILLSNLDIPFRANLADLEKSHERYPCPVYDTLAQKHS